MKTCGCVSAFLLITTVSTLQAAELPITFARSGQKTTLLIRGDAGRQEKSIALWAFGQRWGTPSTIKNGASDLTAPKVRVPVVFRLMTETVSKRVLGELVVYPGPSARWDKDIQLAAIGTPDWFNSWSAAVGLPVRKLNELTPGDGRNWRTLEKPALLVLGQKAERSSLAAIFRLAGEWQTSVLVLETDWFRRNETGSREIAVLPQQTTGALADLQGQYWPLPPTFSERRLCTANRQTWITGPEHPWVEEIRSSLRGTDSLRTVFSYLPWQQQLGRSEMADELLFRLLGETAKGAKHRGPLDGRWHLLYPDAKDIKAGERPILASALDSAEVGVAGEANFRATGGYVLDLRGKPSPPSDFFTGAGGLQGIEARIDTRSQLLILGDDPKLDSWKWLKLDRAAGRSMRPGVLWWRDSSLPPSIESQLRLMHLFTEWNIPLRDNSQETNYEDR